MDSKSNLTTDDYLVAFYDLDNFVGISKKLDSNELFMFINDIQQITINEIISLEPVIIKNIGDANLIIFKKDNIDQKIIKLLELKSLLEKRIAEQHFNSKISFSVHFGTLTTGILGSDPFKQVDGFGEAINTTISINGKPYRGRFNITPQTFRKLASETRKLFHKFTPPIVYISE